VKNVADEQTERREPDRRASHPEDVQINTPTSRQKDKGYIHLCTISHTQKSFEIILGTSIIRQEPPQWLIRHTNTFACKFTTAWRHM
jgi:hypothetical protein